MVLGQVLIDRLISPDHHYLPVFHFSLFANKHPTGLKSLLNKNFLFLIFNSKNTKTL